MVAGLEFYNKHSLQGSESFKEREKRAGKHRVPLLRSAPPRPVCTTNNNAVSKPVSPESMKDAMRFVLKADGSPWWRLPLPLYPHWSLLDDIQYEPPETYAQYVLTCGNTQLSRFACRGCRYVGECK